MMKQIALILLMGVLTGRSLAGTLKLAVRGDDGRPLPFQAEVWPEKGRVIRIFSDDGTARIEDISGKGMLLVRHGIDHDAVEMAIDGTGADLTKEVVLRRRFDAKAMGWYAGENHLHMFHARGDRPATFRDGARLAAAGGLDYIQLGYAWDDEFSWPTAESLNQRAAAASTDRVVVGWNVETPKCYMSEDDGGRKGNLHCFGHGWTVGLKDISRGKPFFFTGPNFGIIQEIHRQGGVVGCAHPVRFWFNKGNFVSNWASELPFDFVAGAPYDSIDILNDSPLLFFQSERVWWNLLNMGYKVSGTGNSDGNLGSGQGVGRFRTYTKIDGAFSWEKLAQGVREGACIATSGPFVQFDVVGRSSGAEFPADGKARAARIRAWSGSLPGESLVAVQVVRNGEVTRAWDLHGQKLREWEGSVELADDLYAWYAVRVLSTSRDRAGRGWGEHAYELAVANPVYFLPAGFKRPPPASAQLTLKVVDERANPLRGEVLVIDAGKQIAVLAVPETGELEIRLPGTASLVVRAAGYADVQRNLYMDTELFEFCRDMCELYPSFYSPETYAQIREMLGRLTMTVNMKKLP